MTSSRQSTRSIVFFVVTVLAMPTIAYGELPATPSTSADGVTHPRNLFKEYMTKGLYQCTSKYVHTLSKLHALIKEAFEEYTECERLMREAPGKKSTENELLDRLLAELDDDEEELEQSSEAASEVQEDLPSENVEKKSAPRQKRSIRARRSLANFVAKLL